MLYDLSMSESNKYESLKNNYTSTVYVIQEIPGTQAGNPKINIMGASQYGQFKFAMGNIRYNRTCNTYDCRIACK